MCHLFVPLFSTAYPGLGRGGSSLSKETHHTQQDCKEQRPDPEGTKPDPLNTKALPRNSVSVPWKIKKALLLKTAVGKQLYVK